MRLPFGVELLTKGNMPRWWVLASRHPRWSITWLWSINLHWGERLEGTYWQKRWGVSLGYPGYDPRGFNVALGPIVIDVRRQHAMRRRCPITSILALATLAPLADCAGITAPLVAFEQRAAPIIAEACARFHDVEASPLVSLAIMGGNLATGGVAGPIVAEIRNYGDAFCSAGPPPGDVTSLAAQAAWLMGVADKLLAAAGVAR